MLLQKRHDAPLQKRLFLSPVPAIGSQEKPAVRRMSPLMAPAPSLPPVGYSAPSTSAGPARTQNLREAQEAQKAADQQPGEHHGTPSTMRSTRAWTTEEVR